MCAQQEWELALQRGTVTQLTPPAHGGGQARNPKSGKSLEQLAANDIMVDL